MKTPFIHVALIGFALLWACDDSGSITQRVVPGVDPSDQPEPTYTMNTEESTGDPDAGPAGPPPICPDTGKEYTGFGGASLTIGRVEQVVGVDRSRVKPYTALQTGASSPDGGTNFGEFRRVMGNNPALLASSATTYDAPPDRWFQEPQGTAVNLYTTYRVGLQSCTTALTATKYTTAPTVATAQAECADWMRKAWSRTPSTDEVDQCVQFAMNETLTELTGSPPAPTNTTPARRWAYTCATVLTAAGFTTY
jgi:hypothetical protein